MNRQQFAIKPVRICENQAALRDVKKFMDLSTFANHY